MLLLDLITTYKNILRDGEIEDYNLETQIIICHFLKITKEDYFFRSKDIEVLAQQVSDIDLLFARRLNNEPISHIINSREFYGLDFYVNSSVLDPRPDSEILVDKAIEICKNINHNVRMAEIGIGSGCLSISIAKNCDNVTNIVATDISADALQICQKNIENHNLSERFELLNCDLFTAVDATKSFEIIISNPPYIKTDQIKDLQKEVRDFEPSIALDGGKDGVEFYRRIANKSLEFLTRGGFLIFEIGCDQKEEVTAILNQFNYKNISCVKDYGNRDRVLIAQNLTT